MIGHTLDDPWAPHPVVNRHICHGGGGGGAPSPPDYSDYISKMTEAGQEGLDASEKLRDWATKQGQALDTTAGVVSDRAGGVADFATDANQRLVSRWEDTYGPLYDAQAADAHRMMDNLPQTEKDYAGKYAADVGQAFDAARASQERTLQGHGLKTPGLGRLAADAAAGNQRAAATAAGANTGTMAARNEARGVTSNALQSGMAIPQVGASQAGIGQAAGQLQMAAPAQAVSTTAGAHSPGLGYYGAATPYFKEWGSAMSNQYNQSLAQHNADANSGGGMGAILGTVGGIAGTALGAYFGGPAGAKAGSTIGSSLGGSAGSAFTAKGGMIRRYQDGGGVPVDDANFVDPSMSPSNGAITDDVPAQLQAGEFVFPEDVVAWRGEAWAHKEIMKARKEREEMTAQSQAEPDMGPPPEQQAAAQGGAISTMPPMPRFRSEGARS